MVNNKAHFYIMKKILLVAMTLVLGTSVFAQGVKKSPNGRCLKPNSFLAQNSFNRTGAKDAMPEWNPIGSYTTYTDFNGNTINWGDTMLAGKYLIIDFSATWCSWCWVMHTNGILENIQSVMGDSVSVYWVEADPSTGSTGITAAGGADGSQGDWTNGGTVPYPIIDNHNAADIIGGNSNIAGFPTVVLVTPSGYWCDMYGTDWGFGPYDATEAVAAVSAAINNSPQPNTAPLVTLNGYSMGVADVDITFSASVISVDPIASYTWDVDNGSISSQNDGVITVQWNETGAKTVSLTVTNTGSDGQQRSTTVSHQITIREPWNWGDEMSYCEDGAYTSSIGLGGNGDITWGIYIPENYMAGREYLQNVKAYIANPGAYDVYAYEGTIEGPTTLKYNHNYNVTESGDWFTFPVYEPVVLDDTKGLWIILHTNGVNYPASYTEFVGDMNGSWINFQGTWTSIQELSDQLNPTWMIKATTGSSYVLACAISGPTSGELSESFTFTAEGPAAATYNWTFEGATPATATGTSATVNFTTSGTFNITLSATLNEETATASSQITIIDCSAPSQLPYSIGFEATESLSCALVYDYDEDGYSWMLGSSAFSNPIARSGNDALGSASFINGIGALTPDNWFVLPRVHIPANDANIEWYDYAADQDYPGDNYAVYVSTGNNVSDFTTMIWEGSNSGTSAWVKHIANITGFANQDVYIAFRHYNSNDVYWLLIDDITVSAGLSANAAIDGVNEANVVLFPNPTSDMVNVQAEGLKSVQVYDMSGRVVLNSTNSSIDMSQMANGVYMFRVSTESGVSTLKVVKK